MNHENHHLSNSGGAGGLGGYRCVDGMTHSPRSWLPAQVRELRQTFERVKALAAQLRELKKPTVTQPIKRISLKVIK